MKQLFYMIVCVAFVSCSMKKQIIEFYGTGITYKTFKEAIENCKDGDSIIIYPGKYVYSDEIFLFANNVSIVGIGKPQLLCTNMQNNVLWIIGDHILIKNVKASHIKPDFYAECTGNVFAIDNTNSITIEDCDINGCGRIGVYISGGTNVILRNNYIHNNSLCAVQVNGVNLFSATQEYPDVVVFDKNNITGNGSANKE